MRVCVCAMTNALPNPKCFPEILRAINSSKKSVTLVNYIAEFTEHHSEDPVSELANALAAAKARGCAVSVILEGFRLSDNYPFYRFLKDRGADVWLDTSQTLIHYKVVVVDDEYLIAGSHNWSHAAFLRNEEFSIGTDDVATIAAFKSELQKITRQREKLRGSISKELIPLPENFVGEIIAPLFRSHAEHAFNLYMIFFFEDGGTPRPLPIDAPGWGKVLGFDAAEASKDTTDKYRRYYYAQRINRVIGQLKKFALIEVDRKKDTVMRASRLADARSKNIGSACEKNENFTVRAESRTANSVFPETKVSSDLLYFGWLTRLSFAAKAFYFLSLQETVDSPFYPWWSESIKGITKKHGFANTIEEGVHELEDYNILEVLRAIPVKRGKFYSEEAHYYRTNPLYDMAEFEAKIARLKGEFSKEIVAECIQVARIFWATHNLDTLKEIALLIGEHGLQRVRDAENAISKLPATSSRRCLEYLMEKLVKG